MQATGIEERAALRSHFPGETLLRPWRQAVAQGQPGSFSHCRGGPDSPGCGRMAWGRGSPLNYSSLGPFSAGDAVPRPVPSCCPAGPAAPLGCSPSHLCPCPASNRWGCSCLCPRPRDQDFLECSFPGRNRPVDFSELPPYLVLPTKLRGTRGWGVGFWPPQPQMVSMWQWRVGFKAEAEPL